MPKPSRAVLLAFPAFALLVAGFALVPARAEQIYRYNFGGRKTALVRGDANVKVEEKAHDISDVSFHSQPTSEHVKLRADIAPGDSAYIHYHYDLPAPAPVSAAFSAGVWVKATKAGVQLRARVVFPKEPDPARPESPLTMLIVGGTYKKSRRWDKLTLTDVPELIGKHLPVIQAKTGRTVNSDGAYIDRLVLNLYTGPGEADVWIDDLDIGPVKMPEKAGVPGVAVSLPRPSTATDARGRLSKQEGGKLFVDQKPFLFRAIRYTGTPLHVLRQAGFNSLWVPADVPQEILTEANREGWLVIPSAPLAPPPTVADPRSISATSNVLDAYLRKFSGSDVLFWDLGGGRVAEQFDAVERTKSYIHRRDQLRPFGADVWDGFQLYSPELDLIGAHRWPLFTSLELDRYRDWLCQRATLRSGNIVFWTWVQNHLPDWYLASVLEQKGTEKLAGPLGPQPEQVRLLTYLSVAAGCRGLGFWSDRFLADSHSGRDRLQGMAILNAELEMLTPILTAPRQTDVQWLGTDNPNVQAALIRTSRGALLLPIWVGTGCQCVPPQGALPSLKILVPLVEDGADPWRISPAGVECLRNSCKKVTGGTELTISEFDLVAPVVFTSDLTERGPVVWWQDYTRKYGKHAARWAMDLAAEEYEKTFAVHAKLTGMGVTVRGADRLFEQSSKFHEDARRNFAAELYDKAYADARRALRPLRLIMRDHWEQATATLDVPTASPYAVSYFSLPKHWELFHEMQRCRATQSVLRGGDFEFAGAIPREGVTIDRLPGWSARFGTLDRVNVAAGIIPATAELEDKPEDKLELKKMRLYAPSRPIVRPGDDYVPPAPELRGGVLKLEVRQRGEVGRDGKPIEKSTYPLERTFLAVESPSVRLPPGTLVRVSAWVKIPDAIKLTADGLLFYDDAGGEPLGVRLLDTKHRWKKFRLYRRVPESGQIRVTVALTGVGIAYVDEVRIEPLLPVQGAGAESPSPLVRTARPYTPQQRQQVQPAGGVRPRR